MANLKGLKVPVDRTEIEAGIRACDRLAKAAAKAYEAIARLSTVEHGGITVHVVGELAEIKIAPPKPRRK